MARSWLALLLVCAVSCTGSCAGPAADRTLTDEAIGTPTTARIVLAGDMMVGRGVAPQLAADPGAVFAGIRHIVSSADIAAANLESPLTTRPHEADNPNALEADPDHARAVAAAGFDLLGVANNHALDAGEAGLDDTLAALTGVGIDALGSAAAPIVIREAQGIRTAWLAFDATGTADPTGRLAAWDDESSPLLIAGAAGRADVVVVGVHGGVEYLPTADVRMSRIGELSAAAGADVVWGHGAHVTHPVATVPTDRGKTAVVSTSLGNLLFDQSGADRTTGAILELLVDRNGVVAYRVATVSHTDRVLRFETWQQPGETAVHWEGSWWTAVRPIEGRLVPTSDQRPEAGLLDGFRYGNVDAADVGDVTGDGRDEVVVSFRRPFEPTALAELRPDGEWRDARGRSAHVGVYGDGLDEIWVAGTLVRPVTALAVCDGALAVAYGGLDDPTPTAAATWTWHGFGFDASADLAAFTHIGCIDLDGDGTTEPLVYRHRSSSS